MVGRHAVEGETPEQAQASAAAAASQSARGAAAGAASAGEAVGAAQTRAEALPPAPAAPAAPAAAPAAQPSGAPGESTPRGGTLPDDEHTAMLRAAAEAMAPFTGGGSAAQLFSFFAERRAEADDSIAFSEWAGPIMRARGLSGMGDELKEEWEAVKAARARRQA